MSRLLRPIVRESFPPFDKACIKTSLALAKNMVESYSRFIDTHCPGRRFVSDVNALPQPKELIIAAYKLWLSYVATDETIKQCMQQFPLLANYQENIGEKPRELFKKKVSISEKSLNDKTAILNDSRGSKLSGDSKLIKLIFDERDTIEKIIHNYLYRGQGELSKKKISEMPKGRENKKTLSFKNEIKKKKEKLIEQLARIDDLESSNIGRKLELSGQAKIGVFWCYSNGQILYANKTARHWLQYSLEELTTMHVGDINPEFPLEAWPEHWQEIKRKSALRLETYHQRKNGEKYPVEIYSNYVKFEQEEYKLAFTFDTTERQQVKDKLKNYCKHLEGLNLSPIHSAVTL